jgi:Zn ribbon nucleic-acid-binding protein
MEIRQREITVTDCPNCESEIEVVLENGLMNGCIRCYTCGHKTCSSEY